MGNDHRTEAEMLGLDLRLFHRGTSRPAPGGPADDAATYFSRSYLEMRRLIGRLAFGLPWALIILDHLLTRGGPAVRGSMSAYYHSPARDLFVGGLLATGGFLVGYMAATPRTYDYWLSTAAGVLVWVVAFFPTGRTLTETGFEVSGTSCLEYPGPPTCTAVQTLAGEATTRLVHGVSAALFVLLLAALCAVFALRQFGYGAAAEQLCGDDRGVAQVCRRLPDGVARYLLTACVPGRPVDAGVRSRRHVVAHGVLGLAIVASEVWALAGPDLPIPFTTVTFERVFLAEVVAFLAFGLSWMLAGQDLALPHAAPEPPGL